jgi:hypothetical protein
MLKYVDRTLTLKLKPFFFFPFRISDPISLDLRFSLSFHFILNLFFNVNLFNTLRLRQTICNRIAQDCLGYMGSCGEYDRCSGFMSWAWKPHFISKCSCTACVPDGDLQISQCSAYTFHPTPLVPVNLSRTIINKKVLFLKKSSISIYDPVFTEEDMNLLEELQFKVLKPKDSRVTVALLLY